MSIYSGFSTRSLETSYNNVLFESVLLMQAFILEVLRKKREILDIHWSQQFCSSFEKLKKLEKQKYLIPYFSDGLKDLHGIVKAAGPNLFDEGLEYPSERQSVSYVSTASLNQDLVRNGSKGNRYSSLQSAKSRESRYKVIDKSHKSHRKGSVKQYQDQILKSILKDLSHPMY
jgi:hypothetical protein